MSLTCNYLSPGKKTSPVGIASAVINPESLLNCETAVAVGGTSAHAASYRTLYH
jgi:hypothetical protein